ncbi:glycosyltransferase family 4 protein [Aquincola tertiaricarbonis]|uniref:glycosyltransferase family 4 protein n=1 Tax=Aquincola tertiaricarbonis TaxID=391953 RepID=UPI00069793C5|nr:glycosyltransferase family 1 protein [Aquincola tertiaricarbonis]
MNTQVSPSSTPVAFTFAADGPDWQGGINYFQALFQALHADETKSVHPIVFLGSQADTAKYGFPDNVQIRRTRVLDRMSLPWLLNKLSSAVIGRPLLTSGLLQREGIKVLSHSAPTGLRGVRTAAWIPDFQHLHLPQFFQKDELRKRDTLFRATIAHSDRVIVSSTSARRDLLAFSPEHADKARVLRFAAIPPSVDLDRRLNLAQAYGLTGRFFYLPNQTWAHKNHVTAIEALARLPDMPDVSIVCSGSLKDHRNPHHLERLRATIDRYGLADRFRMLGMVPYSHIAELMLQAVAVINPSLFEGWSTTVEESKALGVPLILSDIPVHREQCEGVPARFFAPLDVEALAQAMRDALSAEAPTDEAARTRLKLALEFHVERMQQFSRSYVAIVQELASQP